MAHAEGPWNYKAGRALYSAVPLEDEDQEEKYDEDVTKYYERLERARDNARIKRQVRRELKAEYGIDY